MEYGDARPTRRRAAFAARYYHPAAPAFCLRTTKMTMLGPAVIAWPPAHSVAAASALPSCRYLSSSSSSSLSYSFLLVTFARVPSPSAFGLRRTPGDRDPDPDRGGCSVRSRPGRHRRRRRSRPHPSRHLIRSPGRRLQGARGAMAGAGRSTAGSPVAGGSAARRCRGIPRQSLHHHRRRRRCYRSHHRLSSPSSSAHRPRGPRGTAAGAGAGEGPTVAVQTGLVCQ